MLRLLRILVQSLFTTIAARLRRGSALPSWTFRFEWVIAFLRQDFIESAAWPYTVLRRDLDTRRYPHHALDRIEHREQALAGLRAVRFKPARPGRGLILFLHGGGYVFGSVTTTHAEMAAALAERSKREVVGIDYRLAPEHPYPAALDDALGAFDALVASGAKPSDIVLVGDSAGGHLALSVQLALRDRGREQARAAVLISPWLDLTASSASCRRGDALDYGQTSFLLKYARDFAGPIPLQDPRVSPLGAKLAGLAPLFVLVGGAERLHDEGVELVAKAERAGVPVELCVAVDMPHNPPALVDFHPHADTAFTRAALYTAECLDFPRSPSPVRPAELARS